MRCAVGEFVLPVILLAFGCALFVLDAMGFQILDKSPYRPSLE